ncbi:MAG: VOC family protein [Rhodospirillales bacterium]|jgi:methylmalonyl-CoA/ethylmalonyl-CoA epimerase|nr:hypothetical protein [Rhodospirillaceae bacterium]MDP6429833.1 VOC family protein [Rhodospirillales bacterium]MDP6646310.1 VOC family protein [Rhodospirillales bacterium]MDP6842629.1 VOC family protein [Rhodospirillales bacterium]|tara:strand:- start:629 stop:1033 length:405 start_codon:yes stop_codon:yes gene_type:complete
MTVPRIDHIGIIVADLDAATAMFARMLPGAPVETKDMPEVGLRIAFLEAANISIELIQYMDGGEDLAGRVMGAATGLNHFSVEVADLSRAAAELEAAGFKMMEGFPRPGAHGRVAFFERETATNILFEICEKEA